MARYTKYKILNNASEYYKPIRRGKKNIRHYETPILRNPNATARAYVPSTTHVWTYGDRLYNLANTFYGDVRYWWIIAWYNGVPTEAHLEPGDTIEIPINIESAIRVLGA
jgi:hypothetical protein